LGGGIYFWQSNPSRALQFAKEKKLRETAVWIPSVVGSVIELGLCLDLTTLAGIENLKVAHSALLQTLQAAGSPVPSNSGGRDLLLRKLDCAVIRVLHDMREEAGESPIDTVSGIFVEGRPVFDGSGFFEKTHIQVCVCNPQSIKGVFRVQEAELD
jgi:hypothetical protein